MWENEWWLEDTWRSWIKLPDDKVELKFDCLKNEFDKEWFDKLGEDSWRHPLVSNVTLGKSVGQLSYLIRIASYITDLSNVHGYQNVLKAYKSLQFSKGAELELFMAHILGKANYDVSFIVAKPKKGRTPDILAKCENGEFVVECKFLDDAKGEHWFESYHTQFARNIMDNIPKGKALIYIPEDRYLDIWEYGYPNNLVASNVAAFIDSLDIVNHIKKLKYGFRKSAYIDIPNKGTIYWMDETDKIKTAIHTPELNHRFINRRLVSRGVNTANNQIREFNKPGVAAIFQSKPLHETDLKRALHRLFEENKEQYSKLMGVLVFPSQNILKYIKPILVENPFSDFLLDDFNIKDSLYPLLKYRKN